MHTSINETLAQFSSMLLDYGARFVAALVAGALIGIERQVYEKPAGLRTSILVTLGACLFTIISIVSAQRFGGDPLRITAQIVTGIGFIGGGVILHYKDQVKGITTAATIFISAAIGVTAGSGFIFTAVGVALTVFIILLLLKPLDRYIDGHPYAVRLRAFDRALQEEAKKRHKFQGDIAQQIDTDE